MLKVNISVAASQTDSELVAAKSGKFIRVHGFLLANTTNTQFTLNSKGSGAGVAISPIMVVPTTNIVVLPPVSAGYFDTASGESLTCTTGIGQTVRGVVFYQYINA